MKTLFALTIFLFFIGCDSLKSNKENPKNILDTIIVSHDECTGCLDALIINGKITIPDSIASLIRNPEPDAIMLSGEAPYKGAEAGDEILSKKVSIIGYFSKVDSNNSSGIVPVFFVKEWHRLN